MSSHAGHVTTETVLGQTLALQLGNGDEHRALESDTTGQKVKGNFYLYLVQGIQKSSSYCQLWLAAMLYQTFKQDSFLASPSGLFPGCLPPKY